MLRVLTIIFLLGLSFESFAGDLQVRNGKLAYPLTEKFNENGFRPWKIIGGGIDQEYQSRFDKSLHVREASTGLRSASTVPVTLEARVSRKAVLSGAFQLVKRGAALGTRLSGWGTAAYFAYEAYQAVNPSLESAGYEYNDVSNEYLKVYKDALCTTDKDSCVGVDTSVMRALSKGGISEKQAQQLLVMQVESEFKKYFDNVIKPNEPDIYFKNCFWLDGVACETSKPSRYGYYFQNRALTKILEEDEFLNIATSIIDGNPTPFVEGAGKPEYKEKIKVPAGTVVTIGPVTPENGKPVQITITFGQDSNGNTTAEVATTQRPDLTPGGSEAPNTKPDPDPAPNPDGKPDKKPDDNPDSDDKPDKRPDDKPDPDDDPSDKDKRKENKKNDKKEESKGLLCDFFPDILACDKMGKPEEGMFDAINIPQVTDESTWNSDNFLPPNGVCPQPKSFNIWGKPVQISYEPLCVFMEKVRFAVLLGFIIMSAFIVFGSLRK
ncbi:IgG-binding virulence factor TspB family protein [Neisseria sp. RH3002v2g]|uniref:IgG-binding virulence factor TspB family protein n=2 Tax=unclassified Neisseria TaxID=2623750 RepID=UPI00166154A2|nr:IgG-binding virulence factor TspB family protein [Neisseria sp. RH3002v2g]